MKRLVSAEGQTVDLVYQFVLDQSEPLGFESRFGATGQIALAIDVFDMTANGVRGYIE